MATTHTPGDGLTNAKGHGGVEVQLVKGWCGSVMGQMRQMSKVGLPDTGLRSRALAPATWSLEELRSVTA